MTGYIDSIETMGLVDGPGIRMVVFMRGCLLRCLFCHNPETWTRENALEMTSDEIVQKLRNNMSYYTNGGGITFSGGEPLMQPEFLIDCLKKAKMVGAHTALDTSGVGIGFYDQILEYTDLVILDIKAYNDEDYKRMTGYNIDEFNNFVKHLNNSHKPVWIRQVIVPTINDNEQYILGLKEYIKQIKNIEKIELLPYHLYGVDKYHQLNIPYKLDGIPPMDQEKLDKLDKILREE